MLEDNDENTAITAREIHKQLDIQECIAVCCEYYALDNFEYDTALWGVELDEDQVTSSAALDALAVGYRSFEMLSRLSDFSKVEYTASSTFTGLSDGIVPPAIIFYQKKTLVIEVMRNNLVQVIRFWYRGRSNLMRESSKDSLKWNVDRSSPADKIRDFVKRSRTILGDMLYQEGLISKSWITQKLITGSGFSVRRTVYLSLTFALNILILTTWSSHDTIKFGGDIDRSDPIPSVPDWYTSVLYGLGVPHLFFSVLIFAGHFLTNPPSMQVLWLEIRPDFLEVLDVKSDDILTPVLNTRELQKWRTRKSPLDSEGLFVLLLLTCSVLGLLFDGYFFCVHLFYVAVDNDILQRVISAVTKNGASLGWVAYMLLVFIYVFSLVAFAAFREQYHDNVSSESGAMCETELECFATTIRLGLMYGGGTGESMGAYKIDAGTITNLSSVLHDLVKMEIITLAFRVTSLLLFNF